MATTSGRISSSVAYCGSFDVIGRITALYRANIDLHGSGILNEHHKQHQ